MINHENIPPELKALPNWVGFRVWRDEKENKLKKMPVDIAETIEAKKLDHTQWKDKPAESNNPGTWCDYATAARWVEGKRSSQKPYHLGFAFDGNGIIGIDLDKCVDDNGVISEFAKEVLKAVPSYAEYSPSGKGIHILAKCSEKFASGINRAEIEIYQSGRFFTVTGNRVQGSPADIIDCTDAIVEIYNRYNSPFEAPVQAVSHRSASLTLSDGEIISKAMAASNGAKFTALWNGNITGYKSQSEADLALCQQLAFWTGGDATRIDWLFRSSALYRDKWDKRHGAMTYGEKTIAEALKQTSQTYKPSEPKQRKSRPALSDSNVVEKDSAYYLIAADGKEKRLTNFIININKKLVTDEESLFAVSLIGADGRRVNMNLKSSDLGSANNFKKKLNEKDIAWSFLATDKELELIKEHLNSKEIKTAIGFKGVGLVAAENGWVFAGEKFSINSSGSITEKVESFPADNSIHSRLEEVEEISQYGLTQIGKQLLEYNEPCKTVSVLCFMAATLAKPKLNERGIKFPHLVIVGESGSGKSFTMEKIIQSFFSTKGFVGASKVTNYSFLASAGASNCIPLVIDEYKPSTMRETVVDTIHNGLRSLYDGHEGERGRADLSVRKFKMTAPLVLCGEESPSEPALKERSIELLFSKTDIKTRHNAGAAIESQHSQELIRQLGKSVLLTVLRESSSTLRKEYDDAKNDITQVLPDRIRNNIAALCVGAYLLEQTAKHYGTDFKTVFGIERAEVRGLITDAVKNYTLGGGSYNKSVVDQAFEVFDRMTDILRDGVHYKRIGSSSQPQIAFDIKRIYDKFTKFRRDHNQRGEVLELNMFINQLVRKDYFIKRNHPVLLKDETEVGVNRTVKCFVIDAKKLSACCDVSNILERLCIDVTIHPEQLNYFK